MTAGNILSPDQRYSYPGLRILNANFLMSQLYNILRRGQQNSWWQMTAYLTVGGWNTVFGIGFYALAYLWLKDYINYLFLLIPCNIIAITNAYLCYKLFVFRTRGNWLREYLRFYVIYGFSMVIGMGLVAFGVQVFTLHPIVAQALATGVTIVASFFGHKNISFAVPRTTKSNFGEHNC